jgi:hypothetical protein
MFDALTHTFDIARKITSNFQQCCLYCWISTFQHILWFLSHRKLLSTCYLLCWRVAFEYCQCRHSVIDHLICNWMRFHLDMLSRIPQNNLCYCIRKSGTPDNIGQTIRLDKLASDICVFNLIDYIEWTEHFCKERYNISTWFTLCRIVCTIHWTTYRSLLNRQNVDAMTFSWSYFVIIPK